MHFSKMDVILLRDGLLPPKRTTELILQSKSNVEIQRWIEEVMPATEAQRKLMLALDQLPPESVMDFGVGSVSISNAATSVFRGPIVD